MPRLLRILASLAVLAVLVAAAAYLGRRWWQPPPRIAPAPPRWPVNVSTLAGGGSPGSLDGPALGARFLEPFGVAVGRAGETYVADAGDNNSIRRIDAGGSVRWLAGGGEGFADGDAASARFNTPSLLALAPSGELVVADTSNHAIRLVAPDGRVTTRAGDGMAGDRDGPGPEARFNGPVGVAAASDGTILVADTYNDRIRRIGTDGRVTTIAGSTPGYRDGPAAEALFDTPTGIAVGAGGEIFVADTGNDAIRRIAPDGQVTTFGGAMPVSDQPGARAALFRPVGIAASDGLLYVTDGWDRVVVFSADGRARELTHGGEGFANGRGSMARFRNPTGIAVDRDGVARVADTDNYLVRRLTPPGIATPGSDVDLTPVPWLTPAMLSTALAWPVAPQDSWHEVTATLGEARAGRDGDERGRLHAGIDIHGEAGEIAYAVRDEKVGRPIAAGPCGSDNEWLRIGVTSYVHIRVGRRGRDTILDAARFSIVPTGEGVPVVRIRRGTRFRVGDPIGTVNRLSHVHVNLGAGGAELNPLEWNLPGFTDTIAPTIAPNGVQIYDAGGARFGERQKGRLKVSGRVSIVVEAFDRVDGNAPGRRLGVYALGYQVLRPGGSPAPGFEQPRMTIEFSRMPAQPDAAWLVYAEGSGITAYGNRVTRFRYIVTNTLRDGTAAPGVWDTSELEPGDYVVRVVARDLAGNTTTRDVAVTLVASSA